MNITIQRETLKPETMGHLSIDGAPECDTIERPWVDNQRGISCIPAGVYCLTFRDSEKFGRPTLHVENVPNRDGIEVHPANYAFELHGCIAPGKRSERGNYVIDSHKAVTRIEEKVRAALARGEAVTLTIRNPEVAA